jgi:hypothetical protein
VFHSALNTVTKFTTILQNEFQSEMVNTAVACSKIPGFVPYMREATAALTTGFLSTLFPLHNTQTAVPGDVISTIPDEKLLPNQQNQER